MRTGLAGRHAQLAVRHHLVAGLDIALDGVIDAVVVQAP